MGATSAGGLNDSASVAVSPVFEYCPNNIAAKPYAATVNTPDPIWNTRRNPPSTRPAAARHINASGNNCNPASAACPSWRTTPYLQVVNTTNTSAADRAIAD